MKQTFNITDAKTRGYARDAVGNISLQEPVVVTISNKKESVSSAQRRLYWAWLTDAEKTTVESMAGTTKDEWHNYFKECFLVPIYTRDDVGYSEMMDSIYILKPGKYSDGRYDKIKCEIIKLTSIMDASTKQMAEYLAAIERFFHAEGVILRTDYDFYKRAMK